jgi:glycosyltransferase involved in cell wall biosynthesis
MPCHNEGGQLAAVVSAVRKILPTVFVVDDGSTDETAAVAQSSGAQVLRFATNLGKGAALKTGLEHAQATGFRFAITMDGDGQHDPADLPKFLEAAAAEYADLVVGNRMGNAQAMPWLRRQVNRWMSRRLSGRAGRELPDTQCGYRLNRLSAWRELDLRTTGFEVESEMLLAMIRAGRRVLFVPVRTVYHVGQSKIHPLRDTIRWFRWWWR